MNHNTTKISLDTISPTDLAKGGLKDIMELKEHFASYNLAKEGKKSIKQWWEFVPGEDMLVLMAEVMPFISYLDMIRSK